MSYTITNVRKSQYILQTFVKFNLNIYGFSNCWKSGLIPSIGKCFKVFVRVYFYKYNLTENDIAFLRVSIYKGYRMISAIK